MGVRDVVGKVYRVEKSGKNLRDIGYDPFFGGAQFYNLSLNVRKVLSLYTFSFSFSFKNLL